MSSTPCTACSISAVLMLLLSACSSSPDAGRRDIPWTRLSGRLAYSHEDCANTCTSSLFILDARQQKLTSVKTLPGQSFSGLAWAPERHACIKSAPWRVVHLSMSRVSVSARQPARSCSSNHFTRDSGLSTASSPCPPPPARSG